MEFEYDPRKSAANRTKHGVDFDEAQKRWEDPEAMVFPARHPVEARFILLGWLRRRIWAAVFTRRGPRVRLISVRRAREDEERNYYAKCEESGNETL